MTLVRPASKMHECGSVTMSLETIGSSVYSRKPLSGPSAAFLNAALTSSTVVSRPSVEGQVGGRAGGDRHAQREAVELALELRDDQADGLGGTGGGRDDVQRGGAGAAQVLVRAVLQVLVARCRRGSWSSGPCSMPNASLSTLAIGARQFVVHEAFEMMWCLAGS